MLAALLLRFADHDCRYGVVEAGRPSHCNWVSGHVIDDKNADGACRFGVRNLLTEDARPAVDDCNLAGGAGVDRGATVRVSIEKVERCSR